jgi:hypothetical protein
MAFNHILTGASSRKRNLTKDGQRLVACRRQVIVAIHRATQSWDLHAVRVAQE